MNLIKPFHLLKTIPNQFLLSLLLTGGIFTACSHSSQVLGKEPLFNIEIGQMEKQLYLTMLPETNRLIRENYVHQNGLFYVANSHANKVMVLTTFGDLLTLYYDPNDNPAPVTLVRNRELDVVSNLNAYAHDFENIGLISVDSANRLYVEENVQKGREETDNSSGIFLNRVILRFDQNGNALDYLGQEGIGGTPFPYIHSFRMGKNDLFSVVCRKIEEWDIFSFSHSGKLLQKITFKESDLSMLSKDRIPSLDNIFINHTGSRLFLKINFYERRFGKNDGLSGVVYFKESSIWVYDVASEKFISHFDLPKKLIQNELYHVNREVLFDLIGMDKKSNLFFLAPHEENLFELFIVTWKGKVLERVRLNVKEEGLYYHQFYVSSEGIVSGLFAYDSHVEMVQWRTDSIVRRVKER